MTSPAPGDAPPSVPFCYRHPGRETYIRCTRCDRPICPDCMVVASVGHQCPECVAEGRRAQRQAKTHFGGSSAGMDGYVTKALIAINIAVFLLGFALDGGVVSLFGGSDQLSLFGAVHGPNTYVGYDANNNPVLGLLPAPGIDGGGYHRLITAMFIHYGPLHLLLNMWALWVLGRALEAALGPLRFAALYFIAGLGGNVACYVFSPNAFSAGASTALFGLFAAYFLVLKRLGRDVSTVVPVIVINLVFTFMFAQYVSVSGHLGGLVAGAVAGAGLAFAPRENRTLVQTAVLLATFLAEIVIVVAVSALR